MTKTTLKLGFHGRIIDHLGIQMYQSPTAAIAEIVSNAWDADSENVRISFDFQNEQKTNWKITISDDGQGMTFQECQDRYLSVGYNRRQSDPLEKSPSKKRSIMGRKGIGKFAGFGIANFIKVTTVSSKTNEHTEFELDLQKIRKAIAMSLLAIWKLRQRQRKLKLQMLMGLQSNSEVSASAREYLKRDLSPRWRENFLSTARQIASMCLLTTNQ